MKMKFNMTYMSLATALNRALFIDINKDSRGTFPSQRRKTPDAKKIANKPTISAENSRRYSR